VWLRSTEIYPVAEDKPHTSWAISLPNLKFRVLQKDQAAVLLSGIDVIIVAIDY